MTEEPHQSGVRRSRAAERLGDWAGAFSLLIIIMVFVAALVYALPVNLELPLVSTDRWVVLDVGYLIGLALLAVATLCHAMLISPTRSPLTAIWLSVVFGVLCVPFAMVEPVFGLTGADADWKVASIYSRFVLQLLPFVMVFAAGIVMLRTREKPGWFRLIGVGICVALAAVAVVLAAWIPELMRANEPGTL